MLEKEIAEYELIGRTKNLVDFCNKLINDRKSGNTKIINIQKEVVNTDEKEYPYRYYIFVEHNYEEVL